MDILITRAKYIEYIKAMRFEVFTKRTLEAFETHSRIG
jgi:hypothetical protein